MNYSLIIPIYNEGHTLKLLLNKLDKLNNNIEIIIIDDGSNDETKTILENQSLCKVIYNKDNYGKGFSIITGINKAQNDNIILMDGDLEIDLSCVGSLTSRFELFKNHVVIGNRWNNDDLNININTYGNYFFNLIFNFLYDTKIKDILCCCLLYTSPSPRD